MGCNCIKTQGVVDATNLRVLGEVDSPAPHFIVLTFECLRCGATSQMVAWDFGSSAPSAIQSVKTAA
jgi:hypothetical protein